MRYVALQDVIGQGRRHRGDDVSPVVARCGLGPRVVKTSALVSWEVGMIPASSDLFNKVIGLSLAEKSEVNW